MTVIRVNSGVDNMVGRAEGRLTSPTVWWPTCFFPGYIPTITPEHDLLLLCRGAPGGCIAERGERTSVVGVERKRRRECEYGRGAKETDRGKV